MGYVKSRAYPQLIPRDVRVNTAVLRLDYQASSKDTFSLSGNYLDFHSTNGIQTQVSLATGNAIGNNGSTTVFDRTGRASWTHVISPTAINEVRFGFFKDRQGDPASTGTTSIGTPMLPPFGPAALSVNGVSYLGYATAYPRLDPSEVRFQIADSYSWTKGKHTFKFGGDFARVEDYVFYMSNRFGTYTYQTFAAFAADFTGNTTGTKGWQTYSQVFGNPTVDIVTKELTAFAQDEWRITPKLTLTGGLRYEKTFIPQPPASMCNQAMPQTCKIPQTNLNFAPRLGFAYQIFDKTVIRGGGGMFYNRYPTSTIDNLFVTSGVDQLTYSLKSSVSAQKTAGPMFPNILSSAPTAVSGTSSIMYADPQRFRNPYSLQANFALQRELSKNTTLSLSWLWSQIGRAHV